MHYLNRDSNLDLSFIGMLAIECIVAVAHSNSHTVGNVAVVVVNPGDHLGLPQSHYCQVEYM